MAKWIIEVKGLIFSVRSPKIINSPYKIIGGMHPSLPGIYACVLTDPKLSNF